MSLEKEIEGFQRDLEIMEMENRKRAYNSPLAKWMEKRRRKNGRKKNVR